MESWIKTNTSELYSDICKAAILNEDLPESSKVDLGDHTKIKGALEHDRSLPGIKSVFPELSEEELVQNSTELRRRIEEIASLQSDAEKMRRLAEELADELLGRTFHSDISGR